ncbi:MAG: helix-turn-helix domain-containing protein [Actinobacteria bacterium]|nr:MAG: helix-turn-helix domain-containing protein [Actinomycetota bacterium]
MTTLNVTSPELTTPRMTTAEAAARLGVRRETIYAYVSRGLLTSHLGDDGRSSLFDAHEIASFRLRAGRRREPRDLLTAIVSSLTRIDDHTIKVRGRDICEEARAGTAFESIAASLWVEDAGSRLEWQVPAALLAQCAKAQKALNASDAPLFERLQLNLTVASATDMLRDDLRRPAVAQAAARAIATMVEGLPLAGTESGPGARIADRLLPRLTTPRSSTKLRHALNAALVLLADHDLAASTVAARVAASTRAHPYAVIAAGLGALRGPLHGAASHDVVALLHDAQRRGATAAIGDALRAGRGVTGWGHFLYPDGDPRATVLFDLAADATNDHKTLAVIEDVGAIMADRLGQPPNIDFALAAFAVLANLRTDATSAIFAISRSAGWIGHALEEYDETPMGFRPRARYVTKT